MTFVDTDILIDAGRGVPEAVDCLKDIKANSTLAISIITHMAPADTSEHALLVILSPGAYTAMVRGVGNTTGVALVKVFARSGGGSGRLSNLSTRGRVGTGDSVLIAEFIIDGRSKTVVVRAPGPSLAAAPAATCCSIAA